MIQDVSEMTKSDLSFSEDFSLKVPRDLELTTLRRVRPEMVFGFDPAFNDGETSYGTFRFKISPFSMPTTERFMELVELRLWGFHVEGRKVVCAVVKRPDPQFSKPGKAWPVDESHYLYSIEAINVACFAHQPDAFVNSSDCEMFKRIISEVLPAYDLQDRIGSHRTSANSTLRVTDNTHKPDHQILNFLQRTTQVTGELAEAERRVAGIDEFFGPGWREKFDHSYKNTEGIRVSGARSEILKAFHITLENSQFWFTYECTVDSANGYSVPVGILYTPIFKNGIDVSRLGKPEELDRDFETAENIAKWYLYRYVHTLVRRHHPDAVINVVSMKGAL